MKILAIESTCDETAVAVVEDGRKVLCDCIASQVDLHRIYGGVVPEIASRKHIEAIYALADNAIAQTMFGRDECAFGGNEAEVFVHHLFVVDNGANLQQIEGCARWFARLRVGVDVHGKFNLDGASHLTTTNGEQAVNGFGQWEKPVLQH